MAARMITIATVLLLVTGATSPTIARNCSFSACLNRCSQMPDDTSYHGPKYLCLWKCGLCKNPVTGGGKIVSLRVV